MFTLHHNTMALYSTIAGIQNKNCKLNNFVVSKQKCIDYIKNDHKWSFFYSKYFGLATTLLGSTFVLLPLLNQQK